MGHATPHSPALPYGPRPLVRTGKSSRGHFGRRLTERTTSHGLRPLERDFIGSIKPNPPWFDQAQPRCRSRNRSATSAIRIQSRAWQAKPVIFVEFGCSSNHPRAPSNPVYRSDSGTRCASVHSYTILIASATVCRPIMERDSGLKGREEVHRLETRRQSCHNRLWFRPGQINQ